MLRYCLCFASLLPTVAETRCKARHHLIRVPLLEPAAISCPQIGSAAYAAIIEHGEQGSPIDCAMKIEGQNARQGCAQLQLLTNLDPTISNLWVCGNTVQHDQWGCQVEGAVAVRR